jgi:hypothetical protein
MRVALALAVLACGCDWNGLSSAYDISAPPDLAVARDAAAPDLAMHDLAVPDLSLPDLTVLPDLVILPDLVGFSIASVSPAVGPSTGFVPVTITGAGFAVDGDAGTQPIVRFNGVPATDVQLVDATSITATLPKNAGVHGPVTVEVENPGGFKTSRKDVFRYYLGAFSLNRIGPFPVGDGAIAVTVADFNGDGQLDVASTETRSFTVGTLFGAGGGMLKAEVPYPEMGIEIVQIAAAPLNADNFSDLVYPDGMSSVRVRLNDGQGGFAKEKSYLAGSDPVAITVADLDKAKGLDLLVANYFGNSVSVLLGAGDGTFQPAVSYATGMGPVDIAVGDFDGDTVLDLAIANSIDATVSVLFGDGKGHFGVPDTYATVTSPAAVAIADLDGDGRLDLVSGSNSIGLVQVQLGTGMGKLGLPAMFGTNLNIARIVMVDLDFDGNLDLTATGSQVAVLRGDGKGGFGTVVNFVTGNSSSSYRHAVADMDGDGKPDLVVPNVNDATVVVMRNDSQ